MIDSATVGGECQLHLTTTRRGRRTEDEEHRGQHGLAAGVGDNEAENGADRSVDRNEERRVDETSEGSRHEARDHEDDLHCEV
jgi:hypothetical protein